MKYLLFTPLLCLNLVAAGFDGTAKFPIVQVTTNLTVLGSALETNRLGGAMTVISNFIGVGTETNLLYRQGRDLVFTNNGNSTVYFLVGNGGGTSTRLGVNGSNQSVVQAQGTSGALLLLTAAGNGGLMFAAQFLPTSDNAIDIGSGSSAGAWKDFWQKGGHYIEAFNDGSGNYNRIHLYPTATNTPYRLDSEAALNGYIAQPVVVNRNIGALLNAGNIDFVDLYFASQTNLLSSGNMTWAHATNGLDLVEFTHVRTVYAAGANRTVTLPSGWHNINGTAITVTNNTVVKIYVTSNGDTSTSANQTNVFSRCEYYP